jgi:signal transduction histidine kinase
MRLTLRNRILLTLLPLLIVITGMGVASVALLFQLGGGINAILHDNYRSVLYMERLNEALERIDSSFTFALANQEKKARQQYEQSVKTYDEWFQKEQGNITEPGEQELVDRLTEATKRYERLGNAFYDRPAGDPRRTQDYFGTNGLLDQFKEMKDVSAQILHLNQESMERASQRAQYIASTSLVWFGLGLAAAVILAGFSAWRTLDTILRPIQAMKDAALGISAGNLDQVVPYQPPDELGQLAQAFNTMAHRLRDYRQSQSDRLLRVQRTSQATIDSFPDPVLVLDLGGVVEMANPAARRLLGVLPRQDGQAPGWIWQPPTALRQPLAEALQGQRNYLPESFDRVVLLGPSGRERAVLPRILTIRDPYGNMLGAAVVLQDVTRLRLLDQVKSNLVATVSHEFKTPLTSIRLALHLLLEEQVGPLTPKQIDFLLDARDNSERLLAMVNNLLDLTRFEQGRRQLQIQPESPASLLQTAADEVRSRAKDKGIEVVVDAPDGLPPMAADAYRLGNALRNLLDNALTYTDRGGRITLEAAPSPEGVVLSVTDTGSGIPPEHLPHVFEKFFRVPGESRGSGTGLGLAIVNEIVTAHGGTITCESEPGTGTRFRLTLPTASEGSEFGTPDIAASR